MTTSTPEANQYLESESPELIDAQTELYKLSGAYAVGGMVSSPLALISSETIHNNFLAGAIFIVGTSSYPSILKFTKDKLRPTNSTDKIDIKRKKYLGNSALEIVTIQGADGSIARSTYETALSED